MNACSRTLLSLPLVLFTSCLEQEEEIVVHADGSVTLTVTGRGHDHDLTEGYAVPLHGPFVAQNDETRRWMRTVGEDTGSALTRERFESGGWEATDPDRMQLVSRAEFASAEELPAGYAPPAEPYASAYLQRDAQLNIEEKNGKRIYTFVRTFEGRTHAGWQLWDAEIERIGKESLDNFDNWDQAEFTRVAKIMTAGIMRHGEALVRSSLLPIYTEGEATLDTAGFERVVAETTAACGRLLTVESFAEHLVWARDVKPTGEGPDRDAELGNNIRDAARAAMRAGLEAEEVAEPVINAVLERFEWNCTASDCTDDLGDENITLRVHMPGTILGGNYDRIEEGAAYWRFEAKALKGGGRTMCVVSVE